MQTWQPRRNLLIGGWAVAQLLANRGLEDMDISTFGALAPVDWSCAVERHSNRKRNTETKKDPEDEALVSGHISTYVIEYLRTAAFPNIIG